jgi:uroporphyrinogen-III synthase
MAGENADALVARLFAAEPQALTHLRGVHSRGDVAGRLRKAGHDVTEAVLYDQVLLPLAAMARQALNAQHRCVVPLFSPRAAAHFMQIAPGADVEVAALSPAVADVLAGGGAPVAIADRPDIGSMAQLVEKLIVNGPAG